MLLDNQVMVLISLGSLALLTRFLLPRAFQAKNVGTKFALGMTVLIMYTLMQILLIWYLSFGAVSIEDCMIRTCTAVALLSLMMLFVFTLLFCIRDKRPMTQEERMKLKDL